MPPLPHPLPHDGPSGPEPFNLSDMLKQSEVNPQGTLEVLHSCLGLGKSWGEGLHWVEVWGQRALHTNPPHMAGGLQAGPHTVENSNG